MDIKVQRQKPKQREGAQGEMRLVMMGRGTYLYVKGGNQWHSLRLSPTTSSNTHARLGRGVFQSNVTTIAEGGSSSGVELTWDNATPYAHDGTILPPSGSGGKGAPDLPDEPR